MPELDLDTLLARTRAGDPRAHEQLLVAVYDELRTLARQRFRRERSGHTLQSTALVHEAWLRLAGQTQVQWQNRSHFLAVAATAMRRVLVDHARRSQSDKRGGDAVHLSLTAAEGVAHGNADVLDVLDLEDALAALAQDHPEHASIVEMRFFGGMTALEVAEATGVTERTVERKWRFARAWLYQRLAEENEHGGA